MVSYEDNRTRQYSSLCVLLPPGRHARLTRYAACEGISLPEAARRALEAGLPVLERAADPVSKQRLQVLEGLRRIREEVRARYGVYQGDVVNDVRAERERKMDNVMRWHDDGE